MKAKILSIGIVVTEKKFGLTKIIIIITSLPYFGVKLSCVCLMFAYRKKLPIVSSAVNWVAPRSESKTYYLF